jgi:hypothetical protein
MSVCIRFNLYIWSVIFNFLTVRCDIGRKKIQIYLSPNQSLIYPPIMLFVIFSWSRKGHIA